MVAAWRRCGRARRVASGRPPPMTPGISRVVTDNMLELRFLTGGMSTI
jgi:hypothetical protein